MMFDYHPINNSIFCLTAGFYLGKNRATSNGYVNDSQEISEQLGARPEFQFKDLVITPNSVGTYFGELGMGNKIKPYIGIGAGGSLKMVAYDKFITEF